MGDAALTEAEIIRRVAQRFRALTGGGSVETGIGDDAAVLRLERGSSDPHGGPEAPRSLLTTDMLIEGVHFDLSYMSLADVGCKALVVNLSDINAMGGQAIYALGTLGVPKGVTVEQIDELLHGVESGLQLCKDAGQRCALIGGDTVVAPQWIVGFTVIGAVMGRALLRSGAKPGDLVWHSGTLGLSGVGFEVLRSCVGATRASPEQKNAEPHEVRGSQASSRFSGDARAPTAHCRPVPPLALGPWLQRNTYATAAQDLSDSLSQVALQLAGASGAGIELDFRGYEFAPELVEFAQASGSESALAELLLAQAEDYELLFTTAPEFAEAMQAAPVACTQIGRIVAASKGNAYFDELGTRQELKAAGFEHL